jgi:hypothetical protein
MFARWRSSKKPRSFLSPVRRLALATFMWNHRHEILRWGRTLYEQVIRQSDTSPVRAARTGRLLYAIASDDRLRNAKELRKVAVAGDVVDLEVDRSWSELPRLIERVGAVKGVRGVTVNGRPAGRPVLDRVVS